MAESANDRKKNVIAPQNKQNKNRKVMERLAHESVIFYHSEKKKTTRDNRQEFKRRAGSRKDPTLSSTIQYDELHGKEREQKPRSNFYVHTDWHI